MYFGIISSIEEVVFSLRNEYAIKEYETDFQSILNEATTNGNNRKTPYT